ncbi:CoA-binding protein [Salmonella enterica subsp. enterica]|nr:CoA-binding protein [Salmonella enterica subsp. enterica]
MSQQGLEALLRPKSIAVIGASMKPHRAGYLMMRNLLAGGFNGPVLPVTPARKAVLGVMARRISPVFLSPRSGYFMH